MEKRVNAKVRNLTAESFRDVDGQRILAAYPAITGDPHASRTTVILELLFTCGYVMQVRAIDGELEVTLAQTSLRI